MIFEIDQRRLWQALDRAYSLAELTVVDASGVDWARYARCNLVVCRLLALFTVAHLATLAGSEMPNLGHNSFRQASLLCSLP